MGRMLEALKQADTQRTAPRAAPPANVPEPAPPAAIGAADAETEIPFIEWGPRKSMEASPSVLAAPGPLCGLARGLQEATAVTVIPPPHNILFRAVSAVKAASKLAPELIAFHEPNSPISVQYRELFDTILTKHKTAEPQAWLFTSAHSGSGTTTALLNTAISAARLGRRRVVVVDAQLAKPALAQALGLAEKPGLREVLAGAVALDEAVQETEQPDLSALAAGATHATGGIRFLAATMRSLLRQLRQRFDLVFIDAPAWDGGSELVNLGTCCDAVYLVLSPNEADTPEVDELLRRISEQGAKLSGCIIAGR